jgi:hypothetical protein
VKTKYKANQQDDPQSWFGYDPLKAARDETGTFNRGWLKNGESMPPIQRIGYGVVSLVFIFVGLFTGTSFWEDFRSKDATYLFWGIATLFFVGLGGLGLRNVFRFRRTKY